MQYSNFEIQRLQFLIAHNIVKVCIIKSGQLLYDTILDPDPVLYPIMDTDTIILRQDPKP